MKKPAASLFVLLVPGLILLLFSCNPSHKTEKKSAENDNLIVFADPEPPHKEHGMAWIPGGRFTVGSSEEYAYPAEKPAVFVEVGGFWMDIQEVTNAEFAKFVEATGYIT